MGPLGEREMSNDRNWMIFEEEASNSWIALRPIWAFDDNGKHIADTEGFRAETLESAVKFAEKYEEFPIWSQVPAWDGMKVYTFNGAKGAIEMARIAREEGKYREEWRIID